MATFARENGVLVPTTSYAPVPAPEPSGDATAPAAPTGLAATASSGEIALVWDDNSETDLSHYNVYRDTATGVDTSGIPFVQPTVSEFTDTNVADGTQYFYIVTAVDTSGNESAASAEVNATEPADASLPAGIIRDWQFDQATATTLTDEAIGQSLGRDGGTLVPFGLDFDKAAGDRVWLEADNTVTEIDVAADWTISILMKPHAESFGARSYVLNLRNNLNDTRIGLHWWDNDNLAMVVEDYATGAIYDEIAVSDLSADTAALVTVRWDATAESVSLWVNNAAGTVAAIDEFLPGGNGIAFGSVTTVDDRHYDGVLSRAIFWDRRLTDTEVADEVYVHMQTYASDRGETI